jgi:hypothetical protein
VAKIYIIPTASFKKTKTNTQKICISQEAKILNPSTTKIHQFINCDSKKKKKKSL